MASRKPQMRRATDRVEDWATWIVMVVGLLVIVGSVLTGLHVRDQFVERSRSEAADRAPAVARLVADTLTITSQYSTNVPVMAPATWNDHTGREPRLGQRPAGAPRGKRGDDLDRPGRRRRPAADLGLGRSAGRSRPWGSCPRRRIERPVGLWALVRWATTTANGARWERKWREVAPRVDPRSGHPRSRRLPSAPGNRLGHGTARPLIHRCSVDGCSSWDDGQAEGEHGAAVGLVAGVDRAAVSGDDVADEGEPDPVTPGNAGPLGTGCRKPLEDARQRGGSMPGPSSAISTTARLPDGSHRHRDEVRGVAHRVVHDGGDGAVDPGLGTPHESGDDRMSTMVMPASAAPGRAASTAPATTPARSTTRSSGADRGSAASRRSSRMAPSRRASATTASTSGANGRHLPRRGGAACAAASARGCSAG